MFRMAEAASSYMFAGSFANYYDNLQTPEADTAATHRPTFERYIACNVRNSRRPD